MKGIEEPVEWKVGKIIGDENDQAMVKVEWKGEGEHSLVVSRDFLCRSVLHVIGMCFFHVVSFETLFILA